MPFYLNVLLLSKDEVVDATVAERVPAFMSGFCGQLANRVVSKDQTASHVAEEFAGSLPGQLKDMGITATTQVEFQDGALISLLVTIDALDSAVLLTSFKDRAAVGTINEVGKLPCLEKLEDSTQRLVEKKLMKLLPDKLSGPVKDHAEMEVMVRVNFIGHQKVWLAWVIDAIEKGQIPWSLDPGSRVALAWNDGEFRAEAQKLGLLRPWALLAMMMPERRVIMAESLGIKDLHEKNGESDASEAWDILSRSRKGVGPRMNFGPQVLVGKLSKDGRTCTWTHMLLRLLEKVKADVPKHLDKLDGIGHFAKHFKEARSFANQPSSSDGAATPIGALERLYLERLLEKWLKTVDDDERKQIDKMVEGMDGDAFISVGLGGLEPLIALSLREDGSFQMVGHLKDKLKTAGGRVAFAAAVNIIAPQLYLAAVARNVGLAVVGSDPLGCEDVVTGILLQRMALLAHGYDIDDIMVQTDDDTLPALAADGEEQQAA